MSAHLAPTSLWRGSFVGRIVEIALGFPTAIFTTLVLFAVGYWLIALAFGFADFGVDSELEFELDNGGLDGADGSASEASASDLATAFRGLGIHFLPLPVAFSFVVFTGWIVSILATLVFSSSGSLSVFLGLFVVLAGFCFGLVVAGRLGLAMRPIFEDQPAIRRRDLIGRLCVVRTGRVDHEFGQAEVVDAEKSTHLIQVRCEIDNELATGEQALIVDVDDDGLFIVSPDVEAIT